MIYNRYVNEIDFTYKYDGHVDLDRIVPPVLLDENKKCKINST
jgi:hypothetical protein